MATIQIKRLTENAKIPTRATYGSAGYDIYSSEDVHVSKNAVTKVHTGISVSFPQGYKLEIVPRSGLAFKRGVNIVNTPATIDSDYRGEIIVGLIGHTENQVYIEKGERIAQCILVPIEPIDFQLVTELDDTERGAGGFGSTGK